MLKEIATGSIMHPIEKIDLSAYEPGGKYFMRKEITTESISEILPNICGIYKIMRPVFMKISSLPVISTNWKEAIRIYIGFMDTICK